MIKKQTSDATTRRTHSIDVNAANTTLTDASSIVAALARGRAACSATTAAEKNATEEADAALRAALEVEISMPSSLQSMLTLTTPRLSF